MFCLVRLSRDIKMIECKKYILETLFISVQNGIAKIICILQHDTFNNCIYEERPLSS